MQKEIGKLKDENKEKEDEITKLKHFVFNEEIKDLIKELKETTSEIQKTEVKYCIKKGEKDERKIREHLANLKARKKALAEDLYLLQLQEKRKHESLLKLEQQNFQVKLFILIQAKFISFKMK